MKIEKIYSIKEGKWTKWNDTLADAIDDFHIVYTLYPNILQANDYTFSQIVWTVMMTHIFFQQHLGIIHRHGEISWNG